ncbi:metallophosphoesterase [Kushneria sp. AK178]
MLKRFERNVSGHDYVVGDLHGHYALLERELARVDFDPDRDRLFSVGDLIDRGPDSLQCLELVHQPGCFAITGNHEMMARNALFDNHWGQWLSNGGEWSQQYDKVTLRNRLAEAMMKMPLAFEVETDHGVVGIVHAEPPRDWADIRKTSRDTLLWSRQRIESGDQHIVTGIDAVVVGHTPVPEPRTLGNVRYIDLGSFFSGRIWLERLEDVAAMMKGRRNS